MHNCELGYSIVSMDSVVKGSVGGYQRGTSTMFDISPT